MMSNTIRKQIRIGGMSCINCQNIIEQTLRHTAGVVRAEVSYTAQKADVTYDKDIISLKDITTLIEKLDYQVLPEREIQKVDIGRIISLLTIIVSLYVLLQRFGVLNLLVPSQLADNSMGYGMLFVIGLITSVHCIAMCGGINLSQCIPKSESDGDKKTETVTLFPAVMYNLGRVISYTVIGFLLGFAGLFLGGGSEFGLSAMLQGFLKFFAGIFMVIMGINMLGLFPWLRKWNLRMPKVFARKIGAQKAKQRAPLIVGLLNGLMPCGPLQSMQIVALASGNPFAGALSMFLFSLGTVPLMLGLGSVVSALGKKHTKTVMNVGSVLVVVLGLAMISQGGSLSGMLQPQYLMLLIIGVCIAAVVASIPFNKIWLKRSCVALSLGVVCLAMMTFPLWGSALGGSTENNEGTTEMADGVQVVTSTLSPGSYPDIVVQPDTPVRWIIDAPEGSINGCNYKIFIPEYGIEYSFETGENVIEFTPTESGTFQYSCWMGMIRGNISVAREDGTVETPPAEGPVRGPVGSCCGE